MKIWLDTEFVEDGNTIDLLSIGLVREDGHEYYAELAEADRSRANPWVQTYVLPQLKGPVLPRWNVAKQIIRFAGLKPEFWGYHADYDWVTLCQLYGTMTNLPDGWPMYCRDLKQWCDHLGNPKLPSQEGDLHHALLDARWNRVAWNFLDAYENGNGRCVDRGPMWTS